MFKKSNKILRSNHRPYISCEILDEKKLEEIIQTLTPFNYSFELLIFPLGILKIFWVAHLISLEMRLKER